MPCCGGNGADRVPVGEDPKTVGMCPVGTSALETNARGQCQADALGGFGALGDEGEADAAPGKGVAEEEKDR